LSGGRNPSESARGPGDADRGPSIRVDPARRSKRHSRPGSRSSSPPPTRVGESARPGRSQVGRSDLIRGTVPGHWPGSEFETSRNATAWTQSASTVQLTMPVGRAGFKSVPKHGPLGHGACAHPSTASGAAQGHARAPPRPPSPAVAGPPRRSAERCGAARWRRARVRSWWWWFQFGPQRSHNTARTVPT
jgi:hypothetical protein